MTKESRREHDKLLDLAGKEITKDNAHLVIGCTVGQVRYIPSNGKSYDVSVIELKKRTSHHRPPLRRTG